MQMDRRDLHFRKVSGQSLRSLDPGSNVTERSRLDWKQAFPILSMVFGIHIEYKLAAEKTKGKISRQRHPGAKTTVRKGYLGTVALIKISGVAGM
jgi:hypothetical protein